MKDINRRIYRKHQETIGSFIAVMIILLSIAWWFVPGFLLLKFVHTSLAIIWWVFSVPVTTYVMWYLEARKELVNEARAMLAKEAKKRAQS